MARDVRQLRQEASEASSQGKHKRALVAYLELERLEPRDAQWSKRAGETYRRMGKEKDSIQAYARAADRYAQGGFLVQAIAVCKLILQIDPRNNDALGRIAAMNEQIGAGPTRAHVLAESNPTLDDNASVAVLRSPSGSFPPLDPEPRRRHSTAPPLSQPRTRSRHSVPTPAAGSPASGIAVARSFTPDDLRARVPGTTSQSIAVPRTKSRPITLSPGRAIDSVVLKNEIANAVERKESSGVFVIPINEPGEEPGGEYIDDFVDGDLVDDQIEIVAPDGSNVDEDIETGVIPVIDDYQLPDEPDPIPENPHELELEDIEEIPLPEPRLVAAAAAEALASTPLFAGLSQDALEALVAQLALVTLAQGEVLFYEGDPGDALYVIVEGEISVQAEGPPRVEMARLEAGAFIGEVALLTDQPRTVTATAAVDAELLRIDRQTLSRVLATHGEVLNAVLRFVRDRLVDRWTRTSPLFRPFDPSERQQIASRFRFLEVDAGTTLLQAGARPDGLYIVLAGNFSVQRGAAQVASLGPGELIGEAALLAGATLKTTVIARGKSLALCLPAADFRELIMTHPHVLEYIGEAAEHSRKLELY